jgi:hypothetical protein
MPRNDINNKWCATSFEKNWLKIIDLRACKDYNKLAIQDNLRSLWRKLSIYLWKKVSKIYLMSEKLHLQWLVL